MGDLIEFKSSVWFASPDMSLVSILPWIWLAFVIASQTAEAGQLADRVFTWIFGANGGDSIDHGLLHFILQKAYHVGLFAVFGCLLSLVQSGRSRIACLWLAAIAGVVAESLQLLADGRSPQVSDAILNVVAGVGAVLVAFKLRR